MKYNKRPKGPTQHAPEYNEQPFDGLARATILYTNRLEKKTTNLAEDVEILLPVKIL